MQMKRVEKYRLIKRIKRRYIISVVLFLFILSAGFYLVDNSLFWIYGEKTSNRVFCIEKNEGVYEIVFLNKKYNLDVSHFRFNIKRLF